MENTVELINNEVTETVVTEMVSEGAEYVSKGMSNGTKIGIATFVVTTLLGGCLYLYKKNKKAKADKMVTVDEDGNLIRSVEEETLEEK